MAKDSKSSIEAITKLIDLIGGKENVASVTHCLTRLRFALVDPKAANVDAIEELPFVKGCFNNAGQFQVIIGTNVDSYYKSLIQQLNLDEASKKKQKQQLKRICLSLKDLFLILLKYLCHFYLL